MKVGKTKFTIPRSTLNTLLVDYVRQVFAVSGYTLDEFTIHRDGSIELTLASAAPHEPTLPLDDQPNV